MDQTGSETKIVNHRDVLVSEVIRLIEGSEKRFGRLKANSGHPCGSGRPRGVCAGALGDRKE